MDAKWLLLMVLLLPCKLFAQESYISGTVTDSITHEPLAFVSIIYNQAGQGVVTNLEGVFRIPRSGRVRVLTFRYVGYHSKNVVFNPSSSGNLRIQLSPDPMDIAEVIVYPAENPAHRIIKLASDNRNRNNPEKSGPFSYVSYDKMIFGLESDTSLIKGNDSIKKIDFIDDTLKYGMDGKGRIDIRRFLEKQYLFMMESVSSRKYLSPEKNKEEIIASKVSGISQPTFMIMARQFQSFSFYENFITIADRQLLNPISTGSTDKYFFNIEDTIYTELSDSVFIISFRPLKGKNFEGMKGVLYINSHGYAVQNVLAEAYEQKNSPVMVSIQQQYDLINRERWFPVVLSSTIRFNPARMGYKDAPVNIVGNGKTYIVNIDFNPQFDNAQFSDVQIEVNPDAHRQPDDLWKTYRKDSLNRRELETYRVIDSLGKAEHLDRTITSFETILTGYLPGRYWSFDIRRFIDYNPYEGFRFGAGGRTTTLVSKWFTIDGYLAYGLKDKSFKYSGRFTLNLLPAQELEVSYLYRNDVRESGGVRFNETWTLSGSSFLRDYMVEVMDQARESEIALGIRALKYLTVRAYISRSHLTPTNSYGYNLDNENPQVRLTSFFITETGARFKYSFKETFMKSPRGNKFSMGTKYPVVYFNIARGTDWFNSDFKYWRTEIKVTKVIKTKSLGDTRIAVISGLVNGEAPYSKLYVGMGSYKPFTLETEQSFGTMRFNEFLSDKFIGLFIKQDFGKLLFKPRGKFQPEIAIVHNMGIGELKDNTHHANIEYKTMEKGYIESGLLINNIFRVQIFRYGVGVLYRYGPYNYTKTIDNFAFKLSILFNL